jgi:hypothetical protein
MARCFETINVLVYPFLIENLNLYGTFFFYASTSLVVMLWELFTVPDKRGLSLAKIEAKLSSSASKRLIKST